MRSQVWLAINGERLGNHMFSIAFHDLVHNQPDMWLTNPSPTEWSTTGVVDHSVGDWLVNHMLG